MLEKIKFENFTVFDKLEIKFSPGINIFIGENGTGKSNILKTLYASAIVTKTGDNFAEKLTNVFYPSDKVIGRLINRLSGKETALVAITRKINKKNINLEISINKKNQKNADTTVSDTFDEWQKTQLDAVYIPTKDMLANAPGFNSLYSIREIHFEDIYIDIVQRAFIPFLKNPGDEKRKNLISTIQDIIGGEVIHKGEEFFLRNKDGDLEFTLLAEGYRKLGLLWLLLKNGAISNGSILFWDEPETNLNPGLLRQTVEAILEIQRAGTQVFIATHDDMLLNEFELQLAADDKAMFYSLYKNSDGFVNCASSSVYVNLTPNLIDEAYGNLVSRDIKKTWNNSGETK